MATTKITITLPNEQLAEIRRRRLRGPETTVSGFIQRAVGKFLSADAELEAMIDASLAKSGGPPTKEELAWARKAFAPKRPRTSLRSEAA